MISATVQTDLAAFVRDELLRRNEISAEYIPRHSKVLAETCRLIAERYRRGGRLLAFGRGPYATDAQHISVEFIHPIIVGKRALAALDLSAVPGEWLPALVRPEDIVMGFGPPDGDLQVADWLGVAHDRGALTCCWPGWLGEHELPAASDDTFIHQELTEVMYHTLWETVHIFFEQEEKGDDLGAAAFLYPSLGRGQMAPADTVASVEASIRMKAAEDERLRAELATNDVPERLAAAAREIWKRLSRGGSIVTFGNGGSATDANDLALDCVAPPAGMRPIPAISLAMEPATISAIANDVGIELVFLRQLIANGRAGDVAIGISTSGKSRNVCEALREARKRGMLTIGLVGYDGGDVVRDKLADHTFVVHCDYIPRLQEIQASLYHILRTALAKLDLMNDPA
jgi:D-sedoheptulose 7-phosphate isomerase